jgi:pyruvyltransferase
MTKLYYWRGEPSLGDVPNFGDALGSWILDRLGVEHEIAEPQDADLFAVGSVLHKIPNTYEGKVVGAGALYNEHYFKPFADVYALRGHLTAHSLTHANKRKVALGDPGLLVPLWVPTPPAKYALGVIPHWSDQELGRKYSYGHVIDVSRPVGEVLNEIALCKRVISSSLHGIIVADAFGTPRRAELPPSAYTNKWEGADFKWHDYSTIFSGWEFETEPHFGEFWTAPRDVVKKHQAEVRQAFADAGLGYKPAAREVANV